MVYSAHFVELRVEWWIGAAAFIGQGDNLVNVRLLAEWIQVVDGYASLTINRGEATISAVISLLVVLC